MNKQERTIKQDKQIQSSHYYDLYGKTIQINFWPTSNPDLDRMIIQPTNNVITITDTDLIYDQDGMFHTINITIIKSILILNK